MLTITATGDGWCISTGCNNTDINQMANTYAGGIGSDVYSDWFAIDVPVVTGPITAATLSIWSDSRNVVLTSPDTYTLHQSDGFTSSLLIAGPTLGTVAATTADNGRDQYVSITLNAVGLSLLTAAEGSGFVFGGGSTPANGGEFFGYTSGTPAPYLTLTTADVAAVPEPASMALLGFALLAVGLARRSRSVARATLLSNRRRPGCGGHDCGSPRRRSANARATPGCMRAR